MSGNTDYPVPASKMAEYEKEKRRQASAPTVDQEPETEFDDEEVEGLEEEIDDNEDYIEQEKE